MGKIKSAAAIIVKDNKILLEKRSYDPFKGKWVLPGGHTDKGEDVETAVKREVKEETGLDITELKFIKIYPEVFPEYKWEAIVYVFKAEAKGTLQKDHESEELRFVPLSELNDYEFGFDHKRIIEEVL